MEETFALPRFNLTLVGVFAACALALAMAGVFAQVMHSVTERTREIGIRIALGAQRGDVTRMVLREAMVAGGRGYRDRRSGVGGRRAGERNAHHGGRGAAGGSDRTGGGGMRQYIAGAASLRGGRGGRTAQRVGGIMPPRMLGKLKLDVCSRAITAACLSLFLALACVTPLAAQLLASSCSMSCCKAAKVMSSQTELRLDGKPHLSQRMRTVRGGCGSSDWKFSGSRFRGWRMLAEFAVSLPFRHGVDPPGRRILSI